MRKRFLLLFPLLAAALLAWGWASYRRDMKRAYARIQGRSQMIPTPYGALEYHQGGAGPAVLVIHGSGGGFDQGELVAKALLEDGIRWIAPSRFGYLRSALPADATFDDQAEAYVTLLDHLGLEKVAVVALSHGGPSALLLALRHPERVSSLVLVSAGVASSSDATQAEASRQGDALKWIYQRDYRYWMITKIFRRRFLALLGASPEVVAGLTTEGRRLADEVVEGMNPVSPRAAGAAFDNQAAMPNERITGIRVPTLVLHAKDDTLQLFRHAEYAAAKIPGARLVSFERGGHLLLAVERQRLRELVMEHVLAPAGAPSSGN